MPPLSYIGEEIANKRKALGLIQTALNLSAIFRIIHASARPETKSQFPSASANTLVQTQQHYSGNCRMNRQYRCQANRIERPDRLDGKWPPRALSNFQTDSPKVAIGSCRIQVARPSSAAVPHRTPLIQAAGRES
jgi:hypothetical protein